MSTASAVNPLRVAIVATLKTIPILDANDPAIVAHVYHEGEVRRGDPLPRVVLGAAFESRRGASRYGEPGHGGNVFLRCWGEDSWAAQEVYELVCEKLDGVPLALAEHRWMTGEMERVTDYPEPDPEITAHVVIARYVSQTRAVM